MARQHTVENKRVDRLSTRRDRNVNAWTRIFEDERLTHQLMAAQQPVAVLSQMDTATRGEAVRGLNRHAGNQAVQRMLAGDDVGGQAAAIQRAPTDEEDEKTFFGNLAGTLDVAKNVLGMGDDNVMDSLKGLGPAFDILGETAGRAGKGQGLWESLGGGLTKGLTTGLLNTKLPEDIAKAVPSDLMPALGKPGDVLGMVEKNAKASSGLGLAGSALKLMGGIAGEKGPTSDFTLQDAGEYADVGSKVINPKELATQGIQEGMMGWYNLAQAGADYATTGSTKSLLDLGESNLRGDTGPITQGYSMIAEVIGGAATGDWGGLDRIGSLASKGELGALPKLGSWLGDKTYDLVESMPEIGEKVKDLGGKALGVPSKIGGKLGDWAWELLND
ncbi:MAG: hypothetical protein ACP5HS_00170 [Anaerolineae bacterium]